MRLLFTAQGELAPGEAIGPTPLIADSWLVADGAALALQLHERRFSASCATLLPQLDVHCVDQFLREARAALPREGLWLPRLEAYAGPMPQLALWLRECPELERDTRLWLAAPPDPRAHPQIKGPDLAVLAMLRKQARLAGADDALLTSADGTALEAAHAALVWWRGEVLCLPDTTSLVLPSVTRHLLVEIARRREVAVRHDRARPGELLDLEAWTLNSLHGIRPVVAWHGKGPPCSAPSSRAHVAEWSTALAGLMAPIDRS